MKRFNQLSRAEMKNVKGGVGSGCNTGANCSFFIMGSEGGGFQSVNGQCGIQNGICLCITLSYGSSGSASCNGN